MLLTTIDHAGLNDISERRLALALDWLRTTDLAALEPGRHEILGDEVFANVMEFVTSPAESKAFEAHRRYHDIHCVIKGEEVIYVAPLMETVPLTEHDEANDFRLIDYPAHLSALHLRAGEICLTTPADAHKPGCCLDEPAPLKKAVVKVAVG